MSLDLFTDEEVSEVFKEIRFDITGVEDFFKAALNAAVAMKIGEPVGIVLVSPHGVCKFEQSKGVVLEFGSHKVFAIKTDKE